MVISFLFISIGPSSDLNLASLTLSPNHLTLFSDWLISDPVCFGHSQREGQDTWNPKEDAWLDYGAWLLWYSKISNFTPCEENSVNSWASWDFLSPKCFLANRIDRLNSSGEAMVTTLNPLTASVMDFMREMRLWGCIKSLKRNLAYWCCTNICTLFKQLLFCMFHRGTSA